MGKTGFMKPIHLTSLKVEWVMGHDVSVLLALNRPEETSLVCFLFIFLIFFFFFLVFLISF